MCHLPHQPRGGQTQKYHRPEDGGGASATPAPAGPASPAWDPFGPIGGCMLPRLSQTDELALRAPSGTGVLALLPHKDVHRLPATEEEDC